jgi:S1-C subfamily serine protease
MQEGQEHGGHQPFGQPGQPAGQAGQPPGQPGQPVGQPGGPDSWGWPPEGQAAGEPGTGLPPWRPAAAEGSSPQWGGPAEPQPAGPPAGFAQQGPPPGPPPAPPAPPSWVPGEAGDQAPPPRRRRHYQAITYVLVAALAAGAGAGTALALRHGGAAASTDTGISTAQIPSPNHNAVAGATSIDQQTMARVTRAVEPGIVDINSVLAYQNVPAAATGMVLSPSGLVLTNNHVVQGGARLTATVVTSGHRYPVKVVGVDPTQDVALIQLVGASGLRTVQIGDSAKVQLGTAVVAIGNAGGRGGMPSVATGTITSLNRTITASDGGSGANSETLHGMMQSNAPIQPGDSGGAWANSAGQVIGMTTAANTQTLGPPGTSMGFAIPIDKALSIARQIAGGHGGGNIVIGASGYLGVGVDNLAAASQCLAAGGGFGSAPNPAPAHTGALVCSAYPGTPAARAGLATGDVITAVNGTAVTNASSLSAILRQDRPGTTVSVTWMDTNGQRHTTPITLAAGPPK